MLKRYVTIAAHVSRRFKGRSDTVRLVVAAIVILVAFAARLYFVLQRGPIVSDELTYARCAENVLAGRGFVVRLIGMDFRLFLPPAYPVFLTPFVKAFGGGGVGQAVGLVQAILSLATAGLIYATTRRIAGGVAGAVAGALYALHPYTIFYSSRVITETLVLFFFGAFLFFFLDEKAGRRRLAGAGAFLALAALTRPVFLYVGAAAVLALLLRKAGEPWGKRLANVAVAATAFFAVLAPWAIRNAVLAGRPILITEAGGKLLYEGNSKLSPDPNVIGVRRLPTSEEFRARAAHLAPDTVAYELAFQNFAGEKAGAIIAANKRGFAELCGRRLVHIFSLHPKLTAETREARLLFRLGLGPIAVLTLLLYVTAACGMIVAPGRLVKIFLAGAISINVAVHAVTIALLRYRLPTDLMLTLAAGIGVAFLWERARRRRRAAGGGR